jgi:hypothetical protein
MSTTMSNSIVQFLEQRPDRVRDHTGQSANRRIAEQTSARVERVLARGRDAVIHRLAELDREWDVDRALMVNFAVVGGAAYATGLLRLGERRWLRPRRKGWLYFFSAQLGFLLLHGTVGWCPPLPVFRRLGVRTKTEIEAERQALLEALPALNEAAPSHGDRLPRPERSV